MNLKSTENYNAHFEKKKKRKKVKRKKIPVDHISDESDNETENRNICKKRKKNVLKIARKEAKVIIKKYLTGQNVQLCYL